MEVGHCATRWRPCTSPAYEPFMWTCASSFPRGELIYHQLVISIECVASKLIICTALERIGISRRWILSFANNTHLSNRSHGATNLTKAFAPSNTTRAVDLQFELERQFALASNQKTNHATQHRTFKIPSVQLPRCGLSFSLVICWQVWPSNPRSKISPLDFLASLWPLSLLRLWLLSARISRW